jgi:prepilin-type N-terminal cleavage/methylation domain-containing protein/prepilin-type processing-associated H-X9-DG protein
MNRRSAFTLVELLVVIGIIALLIGILLPSLSSARAAASQVRALSDVKQLLMAHAYYRMDHQGAVPLAYLPQTLGGEHVTVEIDSVPVTGLTARRYPHRLMPYLDDVWDVAFSGQPSPDPTAGGGYDAGVSPTYGINSVFLGGDYDFRHRGFYDRNKASLPWSSNAKYIDATPNNPSVVPTTMMVPNTGRHVVFRETEVRRPTELIVFADSELVNGPFGTSAGGGYSSVHAPVANGRNWTVIKNADGNDVIEVVNTAKPLGLPRGRFGKGAATAFFDGHAASMRPVELIDMRLWANRAETEDNDLLQ